LHKKLVDRCVHFTFLLFAVLDEITIITVTFKVPDRKAYVKHSAKKNVAAQRMRWKNFRFNKKIAPFLPSITDTRPVYFGHSL